VRAGPSHRHART